ncbi:hypothetical protein BCR33DRAFT_847896 [Rhizoclosmatium globosum]|uniref:LITAF domain-containing protein n=1 Tax=Rhizoclosmatium globosum TaxID=329046 RepID=A0A1Y2CNH7_9FUNG|nr:hypothetical protein BCR33DRAFT_847896 [Rhizoclosmatium globosum]|eukprot:ORY48496.1 hypothetical protein BCR33DRAFT_847896 [Rhizoclosmatium globosum]
MSHSKQVPDSTTEQHLQQQQGQQAPPPANRYDSTYDSGSQPGFVSQTFSTAPGMLHTGPQSQHVSQVQYISQGPFQQPPLVFATTHMPHYSPNQQASFVVGGVPGSGGGGGAVVGGVGGGVGVGGAHTVLTFLPTTGDSHSTTSSTGFSGHSYSYYSHQPNQTTLSLDTQPLLVPAQTIVIDTSESVLMFCPFCQANCQSVVENAPGCLAWLTSAFLCLVGLGCCFFVPLVAPRCQDQVHKCPGCRRVLAVVPA